MKSLALVWRLARGLTTVGVGAGQQSRVDASRLAVEKAVTAIGGAVCASDAFFPFPDGISVLVDAGVSAFIQPGGSVRGQREARRNRDQD